MTLQDVVGIQRKKCTTIENRGTDVKYMLRDFQLKIEDCEEQEQRNIFF